MALQHKSKVHIHRELKQKIGFEEYLEYINVAHEEFDRHTNRIWDPGMP